jgi:hypothetical protein
LGLLAVGRFLSRKIQNTRAAMSAITKTAPMAAPAIQALDLCAGGGGIGDVEGPGDVDTVFVNKR